MAGYIECIVDCLGKLRSYQSTLSTHDVKSFSPPWLIVFNTHIISYCNILSYHPCYMVCFLVLVTHVRFFISWARSRLEWFDPGCSVCGETAPVVPLRPYDGLDLRAVTDWEPHFGRFWKLYVTYVQNMIIFDPWNGHFKRFCIWKFWTYLE